MATQVLRKSTARNFGISRAESPCPSTRLSRILRPDAFCREAAEGCIPRLPHRLFSLCPLHPEKQVPQTNLFATAAEAALAGKSPLRSKNLRPCLTEFHRAARVEAVERTAPIPSHSRGSGNRAAPTSRPKMFVRKTNSYDCVTRSPAGQSRPAPANLCGGIWSGLRPVAKKSGRSGKPKRPRTLRKQFPYCCGLTGLIWQPAP